VAALFDRVLMPGVAVVVGGRSWSVSGALLDRVLMSGVSVCQRVTLPVEWVAVITPPRCSKQVGMCPGSYQG